MLFAESPPMKAAEQKAAPAPQISWENILTSLEDGVVLVDREGKISFFNQAAEMLTDLPASYALRQDYASVFRQTPWLVGMVKKSAAPTQTGSRGEGELSKPRGRKIPVSLTVSPLEDRGGGFFGTIILMRDLTHRKEMEEDLKRADRLVLLGTLAAGLAHEVKNPLGGIKGAAQLLRREMNDNPTLLQYADIVVHEVDRVNRLIEQLLDLTRPATLNLAALNIHEILDQVLLLEKEAAEGGGIIVKKYFDPSLPPIRGDRGQLTQVFLNLVKNSFQAMNGRGSLRVTTRMETDFHIREPGKERGKLIWVDIEDDGPGIKEEDLPNIFSPFFSTKNGGTGLGLSVCYRIIKEHGGLIRVDSREGAGASFKVSLLVAES
jgi:two-component system nitrogen regulation sensor histidine kinase GlnL